MPSRPASYNPVMNVILRAAGEALDIDGCLAWIPRGLIAKLWRAGERGPLGRPLATSGFALDLGVHRENGPALRAAEQNLEALSAGVAALVRQGFQVKLDIELFVTEDDPQIIALPPTLLARVVELGVKVGLNAQVPAAAR